MKRHKWYSIVLQISTLSMIIADPVDFAPSEKTEINNRTEDKRQMIKERFSPGIGGNLLAFFNSETIKDLGFTQEQSLKLKEIMEEKGQKIAEIRSKVMQSVIDDIKLLTNKEENDEEKIMSAIDQRFELLKEMAKIKVKMLMEIRNILTEEQVEKIKEKIRNISKERFEHPERLQNRETFGPATQREIDKERGFLRKDKEWRRDGIKGRD